MIARIPVRLTLVTVGFLAVLAAGCGAEATETPGPTATPSESNSPLSVINENDALIWLEAPRGKYQEGWATLTERDGSVLVEIDVSPAEPVAQPAHIHRGTCSGLGIIDHRLENVIGGHSSTELEGLTLRDLAIGDLAINLHLSFADFATFTACGEIPKFPTAADSTGNGG